MDNYEFERWAKKLGLNKEGRALIKKVREQPSTRSTISKRGNVIGKFPSIKMGYSVHFESHTVELARIYVHEFDDEVLEYYTQPIQIQLEYYKKKESLSCTLQTYLSCARIRFFSRSAKQKKILKERKVKVPPNLHLKMGYGGAHQERSTQRDTISDIKCFPQKKSSGPY